MTVIAKIYDRITQFNEVPVSIINAEFERMWGDAPVVLIYKDDVFTGHAEPLGSRTLAEVEQQFTAMFTEQEAQQQAAVTSTATLEEVKAKLDYVIMMGE